jgi:hypothetical protein
MHWIRLQVARVAAGWLVFHVCLLVVVPTALCSSPSASAGAECTCEHGDGLMCPMHHTPSRGAFQRPGKVSTGLQYRFRF